MNAFTVAGEMHQHTTPSVYGTTHPVVNGCLGFKAPNHTHIEKHTPKLVQDTEKRTTHTGVVFLSEVPTTAGGYTIYPNAPTTNHALSDLAYRMWHVLLATTRPGALIVDTTLLVLAQMVGRKDTEATGKAVQELVTANLVTVSRVQCSVTGQYRNYRYDLTPSIDLLPPTQAGYRRCGELSSHSQDSTGTRSAFAGRNKDESKSSVLLKEHNKDSGLPKEEAGVVCPSKIYNREEAETIHALVKVGFKERQAEELVTKYGQENCQRQLVHLPPVDKIDSTVTGYLFKAITHENGTGYQFDKKGKRDATSPVQARKPVMATSAPPKPQSDELSTKTRRNILAAKMLMEGERAPQAAPPPMPKPRVPDTFVRPKCLTRPTAAPLPKQGPPPIAPATTPDTVQEDADAIRGMIAAALETSELPSGLTSELTSELVISPLHADLRGGGGQRMYVDFEDDLCAGLTDPFDGEDWEDIE
jgi:hypothetical protein